MRIHWLALAAFALATGCSGLIDDGDNGGLSAAQAKARGLWLSQALPTLRANCIMCHAEGIGGSQPAPTFLAGGSDLEIRDTLLAFEPQKINLDSPTGSRLITRGPHDGPELSAGQSSDIIEWIKAEKEAGSSTGEPEPVITVAKFAPMLCDGSAAGTPGCPFNTITLDAVGGTGASIQLVIQNVSGGSYMTNMLLIPGATGVYIEHPLFVTWPADPTTVEGRPGCQADPAGDTFCTDALDRFATLTMNVASGAPVAMQQIATGTTTFTNFVPTDMMSIQFKVVSAAMP